MQTTTQFLRFTLAGRHYAFDVHKTREVLPLVKITPLPDSLTFLSGVIALRGGLIPVVDLRRRLALPEAETPDTAIIILEVRTDQGTAAVGVIVDSVQGVSDHASEDLEPAPKFGLSIDSALILALAKSGRDLIVLLDTDKVVSGGGPLERSEVTTPKALS